MIQNIISFETAVNCYLKEQIRGDDPITSMHHYAAIKEIERVYYLMQRGFTYTELKTLAEERIEHMYVYVKALEKYGSYETPFDFYGSSAALSSRN